MANNIWSNYTEKTATPVDADEVMVRDSTDGKNKRLLFGTFWKWVAKKLNEATISELETDNKTIIGAINALNSKTKITEKYGESTTDGYLNSALLIDINGMYRDLNTLNFRVNKSITKEMPGACNFGIRKVIAYDDNNYLVYIVEFYPIPGRIWTNKYIKKTGWIGWKSQEPQS